MLKAAYDACQVRMVDDALIRQNMGIKPAARPTQHALPPVARRRRRRRPRVAGRRRAARGHPRTVAGGASPSAAAAYLGPPRADVLKPLVRAAARAPLRRRSARARRRPPPPPPPPPPHRRRRAAAAIAGRGDALSPTKPRHPENLLAAFPAAMRSPEKPAHLSPSPSAASPTRSPHRSPLWRSNSPPPPPRPLRPSPVRPNTAHAAAVRRLRRGATSLARRGRRRAVPTPSPVAAPAAGFAGYSEERTQPGWRAVSDAAACAVSEIIDAPPTQLSPLDLFSPTLPPPRHAAIATPRPCSPRRRRRPPRSTSRLPRPRRRPRQPRRLHRRRRSRV